MMKILQGCVDKVSCILALVVQRKTEWGEWRFFTFQLYSNYFSCIKRIHHFILVPSISHFRHCKFYLGFLHITAHITT